MHIILTIATTCYVRWFQTRQRWIILSRIGRYNRKYDTQKKKTHNTCLEPPNTFIHLYLQFRMYRDVSDSAVSLLPNCSSSGRILYINFFYFSFEKLFLFFVCLMLNIASSFQIKRRRRRTKEERENRTKLQKKIWWKCFELRWSSICGFLLCCVCLSIAVKCIRTRSKTSTIRISSDSVYE